jgi:hypothetical protein
MEIIRDSSGNIEYLDYEESELIDRPLWWQLKGLSYTASGYGSKIPTSKMIKHNGRLKRIYVICYSNAGSAFILDKGKRLFLR